MLVESQLDSLPYLDPTPSGDEVALAKQAIELELEPEFEQKTHPNLPQLDKKTYLTPVLQEELAIRERGGQLEQGVDVERYSQLYDKAGKLDINKAFVTLAYTRTRLENLTLLSEYGKNQWLIGNDVLEHKLKSLEQSLEEQNRILETINNDRRTNQEGAQTTYQYLQSRWKDSLKGVVDVNVECLSLQQQIQRLRGE